jgi:hypothetical protein
MPIQAFEQEPRSRGVSKSLENGKLQNSKTDLATLLAKVLGEFAYVIDAN